ncbi:unnamed protein product [Dibothriocephalus latus]|uniref:Uncharacterized protein n=1 Tax=Dibothriocephalus latus TaxID=60516 RepID=A0A3P7RE92_DIBLA|nr:unnamed protein product [Dibothriocephalus latus]
MLEGYSHLLLVQLEVTARIVQDQLRGDKVNEIRVKFVRRIKEICIWKNALSPPANCPFKLILAIKILDCLLFARIAKFMTAVPLLTPTNIKEAWLIKGLRLLYSQKPEDGTRLRRFYKDACDNEAHVLRTTLSEALRESKEDGAEVSYFSISLAKLPIFY